MSGSEDYILWINRSHSHFSKPEKQSFQNYESNQNFRKLWNETQNSKDVIDFELKYLKLVEKLMRAKTGRSTINWKTAYSQTIVVVGGGDDDDWLSISVCHESPSVWGTNA